MLNKWSISQLKNSINAYDPFLEHRVNGLKAVFILEILFAFNYIYTVANPYFYYFYIPLTGFAAEIAGQTLEDKFQLFIFTMLGTIVTVFLFGILAEYKIFFVLFVFFYSLIIYALAIYRFRSFFVPAPLIFSLAAYSLIYGNSNSNFYVALNHALQSLLASLLIVCGLLFFPKLYYYRIWRRGFLDVLNRVENMTAILARGEALSVTIVSGTLVMERFAKMLSPRTKVYSVLKINLLSLDLVMSLSYLAAFQRQIKQPYIVVLHKYVSLLQTACITESSIPLSASELPVLNETYELQILHQLIQSWNYLCKNR